MQREGYSISSIRTTSLRTLTGIFAVIGLLGMLLYPVQHLDATTVRRLSLEEMVQTADRIFVGTCLAVDSRRDGYNLQATYVTFQVIEPIKGKLAKTVVIKQIGSTAPGTFRIVGMPTYQVGEKVLLFLYPNSRHGFTSPVGLQQGKWTAVKTAAGKQLWQRGLAGSLTVGGSTGALYGLSTREGLFHYAKFLALLKKMVAQ